jgi:hypothetical protein
VASQRAIDVLFALGLLARAVTFLLGIAGC